LTTWFNTITSKEIINTRNLTTESWNTRETFFLQQNIKSVC
jgi:hypothetical protein